MQVLITDIVIPENRFRREFDEKALKELQGSIKRNGLINPITVERSGEKYILRAGERRLKATIAIEQEAIEVRLFEELTPLQRLEIEVEENVVRSDFTWQERTKALAALHGLRSQQNPGQTIAATASEALGKEALGDQRQQVSDALIVSKHLDDPDVAKAKSQREAIKVIEKKAGAIHRARLALRFDPQATPHTLLKGDALVHLKAFAPGVFDVILTDPPYGVGADQFGSMSSTRHNYRDSEKYWEELMQIFPDACFRVTREQAHCYAFCDPRRFDRFSTLMVLAGWTVFPVPLIWDKGNHGMLPFPNEGPRRSYEAILYAWKGGKHTLLTGRSDVIRGIPAVHSIKHGAQKPVALYEELLSRSAAPGDRVLDCFGGTGPLLVAANRMRLVATYIEVDEDSFNTATERVGTSDLDDGVEVDDGLGITIES